MKQHKTNQNPKPTKTSKISLSQCVPCLNQLEQFMWKKIREGTYRKLHIVYTVLYWGQKSKDVRMQQDVPRSLNH